MYIYKQYKQEKHHWKKLCVSSFEKFYFNLNHEENKVEFLQSSLKQKIIYYTSMEATGWLFEMVSLLGVCSFKLHGIFILFYQIFVWHVSPKESIIFISFHKIIWRYDDVTTALWQNQMTVISYSVFLKCLNKVLCLVNRGFYRQQTLMRFEEKHKKQILLVSCVPIVLLEQHYQFSPKK